MLRRQGGICCGLALDFEANRRVFTVHRLNLFPLMHLGFLHMLFNILAVTPLLERFEAEFGTIVTLSLFTGRKIHLHTWAETQC